MKRARLFSVLSTLMLISPALAQTATVPAANDPSDRVVTARCQYVPSDEACPAQSATNNHDQNTVAQAQFPRRMPGRPLPRRPIGPPPFRSPMWFGPDDGRHVAIGALIGFGIGAALGVKANSDQHANAGGAAALLGGGLGACFGAAIGHAIGSFPHRYRRSHWPGDEDEDAALRVQGDQGPHIRASP